MSELDVKYAEFSAEINQESPQGQDEPDFEKRLRSVFQGKIVRKDLTKKIKEGANVLVYVLEFLLGQYCSSEDEEIIQQGIGALDRLYNCKNAMDFGLKNAPAGAADSAFVQKVEARRVQFIAAMDDDLNTADAIASIFELVRDINTNVVGKTPSKVLVEGAIAMFDELTGVLGLVYNRKTETLDSDVEALIEARTNARKEKNWAEADRIRDQLKEMGIVLEDTAQGVKWHRE